MFNSKVRYAGYFSREEYPIIEAISNNDKDKLQKMMEHGWNVNSSGKDGMTYLYYAVFTDNYKMTEFLLEKGAGPNLLSKLVTPDGEHTKNALPIESACYDKHNIKFLKLLIKHGANVNDDRAPLPIFAAALNNDKRKIEYLLEHGADINKLNKGMETVITETATVYQWDLVLWFGDKGGDPMKTGKNGFNVAVWVQEAINSGNNENKEIKQVIARLESIGVKFPYRPALQTEQDGTETNN